MRHFFLALSLTFCASVLALATGVRAEEPPRPPQFVFLAFDGSLNLDMWRETLEFAEANAVRFTYFISGVYFLLDARRNLYVEPTHGAGHSAIGFGGETPEEILERVAWVNRAFDAGHEIGSHANGHYDGSRWTLAEWQDELSEFSELVFDVALNNRLLLAAATPYRFDRTSIRGFRAPLLGENGAMYIALAAHRYAYDTSKTAEPDYWPQKESGIWNFPLARLRIAGTGKRTLSMDYNFYFAQSEGKPDPAHAGAYRDEMLRTYLAYFAGNYLGNRAPVHIGHHFSKWNDGAYWAAMQEFAHTVCHLPEVRCTTYRDLEGFLEQLPPATLAAYRSGRFDRSGLHNAAGALAKAEAGIEADLLLGQAGESTVVRARVVGAHAARVAPERGAITTWILDGRTLARGSRQSLDLARHLGTLSPGSRLTVTVEHGGREVLKATHGVRRTPRGFQLAAQPDEARALTGDHPQAHADETARETLLLPNR